MDESTLKINCDLRKRLFSLLKFRIQPFRLQDSEKTRIDPILIDNQIRDGSFINVASMRHVCDTIRSIIQITKKKMEC